MNKKNVLLINLGTPKKASAYGVYRYLTEFLNDKRVIDLPTILRWLLVNGIIIPFRFRTSQKAYQAIWTSSGSPLLVHNINLQQALSIELGPQYSILLGMRYGEPNIKNIITKLKNSDELIVIPLFPHYSSAATGSAIAAVMRHLALQWNIPSLKIINDFYADIGFIHAYSEHIQTHLNDKKIDLLLFSYHGLPERHIEKSNCTARCDRMLPCPKINEKNRYCYRAQCYETARLLAKNLELNTDEYAVAFQSRLGKTPWIKPYTDHILSQLIKKNIKILAVTCPSFVTDCLETLEEINIRLKKQWLNLGGKEFIFIPSLNNHSTWVKALGNMIKAS